MSRARIAARLAAEANTEFNKCVAEGSNAEHERAQYIEDWVADGWAEAEQQAAEEREAFGLPDDTPSLEDGVHNCNDFGTGEGRYHGRM